MDLLIKILHVITDLDQGGAENALLRLIENTSGEFEHQVLSLVSGGVLRDKFENIVEVQDLGLDYGSFRVSAIFKLFKIIKTDNWNIVQGWMYHGNLVASLITKVKRNPALIHGIRQCLYPNQSISYLSSIVLRLNAFLSKGADLCLYNSELALHHHISAGFNSDNSQLWFNGFDFGNLTSDSIKRKEYRSKLGLSSDAFLIGSLGRDHPMKDYPTAFRALARLELKKHNIHYLLGGKDLVKEKY